LEGRRQCAARDQNWDRDGDFRDLRKVVRQNKTSVVIKTPYREVGGERGTHPQAKASCGNARDKLSKRPRGKKPTWVKEDVSYEETISESWGLSKAEGLGGGRKEKGGEGEPSETCLPAAGDIRSMRWGVEKGSKEASNLNL